MSKLSDQSKQLINFYEKNYDTIVKYELYEDIKQFIGSPEKRKCRFCKKTPEQTSFKNEAHAIPTFLGNRSLFTHEECDSCNHMYGDTLEDQFAKFLGIRRTMSKINGRNGVATHKLPGKSTRVSFNNQINRFEASGGISDIFFKMNPVEKTIDISTQRQPYRKRSAFKCLVKIALNIMPQSELKYFEDTIKWIKLPKSEDDRAIEKFYCFYSVSPTSFRGIDIFLLKRKVPLEKLPYMSLYLSFRNFTYQIFMPYCSEDHHLIGQAVQMNRLPALHEVLNTVKYTVEDLSSNNLVTNEDDSLRFTYSGEPIMKITGDFPQEIIDKIIVT